MKERREVWGLYNWRDKVWMTEGDQRVWEPRLRFSTVQAAADYASMKTWFRHIGPRPYYLVKKPNPRAERTKRVIDAAREYRNIEGFYGGNDEQYEGWKVLNRVLKEYDGEEITRDDL